MPGTDRPVSALYNTEILRLATSIPHLGRLESPQATAERRAPLCGSRVTVDVNMDDQMRVSALGLKVNACALGQASAALMASHAIGRNAQELHAALDGLASFLAGQSELTGDWPGLDIFAPAVPHTSRHGAILLAFQAVADAVEQAGAG